MILFLGFVDSWRRFDANCRYFGDCEIFSPDFGEVKMFVSGCEDLYLEEGV